MARPTPDFSSRILAIAVVIAVLLGALVWLLSGLGSPADPEAAIAEDAQEATEGDAPLLEAPPGEEPAEAEATEPAVEATAGATGVSVTVQLYLVQGGARELVPRVRRLRSPDHPAAKAQLALQTLINAGEPGYVSPLPPTTIIREVWVDVDNGVAYVDFARGFAQLLGGGSLAEIHAVYGVVGTLTTSFPEVSRVQFLVDGRPVDSLTGHLDLSMPIGRESDWLY